MTPEFGEVPTYFTIGVALFAVFFVLVLVLIIRGTVRNRRVLRQHGLDPLTAQAELAVRFAQGPLGAPVKSLEHRLVELDDLHRRGLISSEEHAAARRAALTEQP
jgi:hypothetical protein